MTHDATPAAGMDRRTFVAAPGGAAAGLALGYDPASALSAARSPAAGWLSRRTGAPALSRVGVQLYTVRSLMEQDVEKTLRQVGEIGYREVEFAGYYDLSPARIRTILDDAGLSAPSAHTPLEALEGDGWSRTREAAEALGHRYLVVPWIAPDARRTLDDYRRLAARLEEAGARARDAGLQLAYHNHDFEFEPIDGTVPYEILMATDPSLVQLQLDLFWARKAGADAAALFGRYPGRFPSVHVKDMTADGDMTAVGGGVIDWASLFAHADTAGIRHYFVEHDQPEDPLESIRASFRHLRTLDAA